MSSLHYYASLIVKTVGIPLHVVRMEIYCACLSLRQGVMLVVDLQELWSRVFLGSTSLAQAVGF